MVAVLDALLGSPERACRLLQELFPGEATLLFNPEAGTLTVSMLCQASCGQYAALAPEPDELKRANAASPGTLLLLVYEPPQTTSLPLPARSAAFYKRLDVLGRHQPRVEAVRGELGKYALAG